MTEENVAPEVTDTENTDAQTEQAQAAEPEMSVDELKSYAEAAKAKKRETDNENKALRARLKEYEAAAKSAEDSVKSTEQKLQDQLTDANTRYEALFQRIVKTEATATATGVLADPSDALRYLDLTEFTTEDGLDKDAFQKAVKDLAKERKYLAAQAVAEAPVSRGPKPDPTQASAGNGATSGDPHALFAAALNDALNKR